HPGLLRADPALAPAPARLPPGVAPESLRVLRRGRVPLDPLRAPGLAARGPLAAPLCRASLALCGRLRPERRRLPDLPVVAGDPDAPALLRLGRPPPRGLRGGARGPRPLPLRRAPVLPRAGRRGRGPLPGERSRRPPRH